MRVLFDECVPRQLRSDFHGHEVRTVQEMGWAGTRNGALLARAGDHFDAVFTVDRAFAGPPAATGSRVVLVILARGTTNPDLLRPGIPAVLQTLASCEPGQVCIVGA